MPVKSEKAYVHIRLRAVLAHELRKIAKTHRRPGVQIDANIAVEEYVKHHKRLVNKRDNGR